MLAPGRDAESELPTDEAPKSGDGGVALRRSWLAWCATHTDVVSPAITSQSSAGADVPQWVAMLGLAGAQQACTRGAPQLIPNATTSRAATSRYVGDVSVTAPGIFDRRGGWVWRGMCSLFREAPESLRNEPEVGRQKCFKTTPPKTSAVRGKRTGQKRRDNENHDGMIAAVATLCGSSRPAR